MQYVHIVGKEIPLFFPMVMEVINIIMESRVIKNYTSQTEPQSGPVIRPDIAPRLWHEQKRVVQVYYPLGLRL